MSNGVKCQRAKTHVGMARGPARRRYYYFKYSRVQRSRGNLKQSNTKSRSGHSSSLEKLLCYSHYDNYLLFYHRYQ